MSGELREPSDDVVDALQTLLNSALVGDLQGVAIAATYGDGRQRTAWRGAALEDRFRMLGGLVYLAYRILTESIDDDAELDEGEAEDDSDTEA